MVCTPWPGHGLGHRWVLAQRVTVGRALAAGPQSPSHRHCQHLPQIRWAQFEQAHPWDVLGPAPTRKLEVDAVGDL